MSEDLMMPEVEEMASAIAWGIADGYPDVEPPLALMAMSHAMAMIAITREGEPDDDGFVKIIAGTIRNSLKILRSQGYPKNS